MKGHHLESSALKVSGRTTEQNGICRKSTAQPLRFQNQFLTHPDKGIFSAQSILNAIQTDVRAFNQYSLKEMVSGQLQPWATSSNIDNDLLVSSEMH